MEFRSLNPGSARARAASDVVLVDGWAALSGVLPIDLADDKAALGDGIEPQTAQALANVEALLADVGMTKADVVSVRVSLIDFARLHERMTAVYVGFFPPERRPTLSCVGVTALPRGALIALDVLARRNG